MKKLLKALGVPELESLFKAMKNNDIGEMTIEINKNKKIQIRNKDYQCVKEQIITSQNTQAVSHPAISPIPAVPAAVQVPQAATPAPASEITNDSAVQQPVEIKAESNGLSEITAPLVGTFYLSPSPESPPYVKIGDRIKAGQILCIIEAMKNMNEIEADVSGVIVERSVENSQLVEFGQVLYKIQKD